MDDRSGWAVTTHEWTADVDPDHLAAIRRAAARYLLPDGLRDVPPSTSGTTIRFLPDPAPALDQGLDVTALQGFPALDVRFDV